MGKPLIDLTGQTFGKWFVIQRLINAEISTKTYTQARWFCRCECGTLRLINSQDLRNGTTTNCGCGKTQQECGEKNRNWKGGRRPHSAGYVQVSGQAYPLEHQCVMSENLGRPLYRGETIHHKNGIRTDNRVKNLELWTTSHPKGQRVVDLLEWAHEILDRYKEFDNDVQ